MAQQHMTLSISGMKRNSIRLYACILTLAMLGCNSAKLGYYDLDHQEWSQRSLTTSNALLHTLYLIGDAGELDDHSEKRNYVLEAFKDMVDKEGDESTVVFLGDNIYPQGLPHKGDPQRPEMEDKINSQLESVRNFEGHTYFIPGNHDWMKGHKGGLKAIQRQEDYVQNYYEEDNKVRMYPNDGCGDPEVKKIHKDLAFVFIDSQWWLEDWTREPKMNRGCDIKSRGDFLKRMEEIFLEHKNDQVVVLMHHPVYSNGIHGAKFSSAHHLLPFQELGVPIPLPILGSVYPLFRSVTGSVQDIPHTRYQQLVGGLLEEAKKVGVKVIFAAGHEHDLQYFEDDDLKFVVSGSGSKKTFTASGSKAIYAQEERGFARVLFYENSEAWIEYYTVNGFDEKAVLSFRKQLYEPRAGTIETPIQYPPIEAKDTLLAANPTFRAGGFKKFLLGAQYREIWSTPVTARIIDLEEAHGGLVPIKKGGGMASNSLRMMVEDGRHYILRSINKDYTKLVPEELSNLKLINIMRDQNSASHPYGALVLPKLSKAANIYYTTPKLVYLKHQKALGNYNQLFPEELYLLEERPDEDWSEFAQFGNSEKIIGYVDLLNILEEKKTHFVDQEWVLKSRLFDVFIHDWDRHDDQWRWATFEENGQTIYRPIPRDRDQVFYKFQGVVPSIVATFFVKKFKSFKEDVKDVKNQSFNARYFDRYFLNGLAWQDWEPVIQHLQKSLTDSIINEATKDLPDEIEHLNRQELATTLIARRNNLRNIGRRLYEFLTREVEVIGSNDDNLFEVIHHANGSTQVQVSDIRDEKGDLLKYDRTFFPDETKEVRLYGLRGKDDFKVSGTGPATIKIRVIGGEDKDEIINGSSSGKVLAYDVPDGIKLEGKIKDKTENKLGINEYDRRGFKYNSSLPSLVFGITPDDGLWIGGGYSWTTHGWRKEPYKTKQSISASLAPGSQRTFNVRYNGVFRKILGPFDFAPDLHFRNPDIENYFGLGNETVNPLRERSYHWVRMESYTIRPMIGLSSYSRNRSLYFGPTFQSSEVDNTQGRVSSDPEIGLNPSEFLRRDYLGFNIQYTDGYQDDPVVPTNGFRLDLGYNYWNLINLSQDEQVSTLRTAMRFYIGLSNRPKFVLASRLGYEKVFGDPQFYHYPSLGNNTNLRGYRNDRFRGESLFYQNIDLRLKILESHNNFIPFDIGLVGGFDYGRVWQEGENSDTWHNSITAGVWFDILSLAVIQPYIAFNEEETIFTLRFGFNF